MEYKWKQVQAGLPTDAERMALKLTDSADNITYGIGYYLGGEWTVTAREDDSARLVVAWTPLPKS